MLCRRCLKNLVDEKILNELGIKIIGDLTKENFAEKRKKAEEFVLKIKDKETKEQAWFMMERFVNLAPVMEDKK
jgi:hypothetical protein